MQQLTVEGFLLVVTVELPMMHQEMHGKAGAVNSLRLGKRERWKREPHLERTPAEQLSGLTQWQVPGRS